MKRSQRPTIRDVAKLAKVSEGAVSAVLNNRVGQNIRVSEATQMRIHEAVRKLGYVANPVARSLAQGRTNMIALFTFEPVFPVDHRDFYYPFFIGIEQEAERRCRNLLLITGGANSLCRRVYEDGVNRLALADGALLFGFENKDDLTMLLEEGFPFVFIGRRDLPGDHHSYVMADYREASANIVQYLSEHNHRRIAYFQSTKDNEPTWDRLDGVLQGLRAIGQDASEALIWTGEPHNLSHEILQGYVDEGVTAFIAEDDQLGGRVMNLTREMGLHCPADFSLAVLGDALSLVEDNHTWTMWKAPRREMGAEAVRLLIQLIEDPKNGPYRRMLKCHFSPGDTVACAKR